MTNQSANKTAAAIESTDAEHAAQATNGSAAEVPGPEALAQKAADQIADSLGSFASSIRQADLGNVGRDLAELARQNPLIFFGGAALLGFAAGRVLKASAADEATEVSTPSSGTTLATRSGADPTSWGYS